MGDLGNYELLKTWVSDKCIPLVREITFENAEELTEEGLPFLLLFHHPEDTASIELFKSEVAKQLIQEKGNLNPFWIYCRQVFKGEVCIQAKWLIRSQLTCIPVS